MAAAGALSTFDSVLFDLVVDSPAAYSQQMSGFLLNETRLLQSPQNRISFALVKRQRGSIACRCRGLLRCIGEPGKAQVAFVQDPIATQDDAALQGIFEFSHIPRPGIFAKPFDRFGRQLDQREVLVFAEVFHELLRKDGYVLAPFPQGRDLQRYYAKPIIEVLAKVPCGDLLGEVDIGG